MCVGIYVCSLLYLLLSGRGTSPKEGVAIAQAILEYIHNSISKFVSTICCFNYIY